MHGFVFDVLFFWYVLFNFFVVKQRNGPFHLRQLNFCQIELFLDSVDARRLVGSQNEPKRTLLVQKPTKCPIIYVILFP